MPIRVNAPVQASSASRMLPRVSASCASAITSGTSRSASRGTRASSLTVMRAGTAWPARSAGENTHQRAASSAARPNGSERPETPASRTVPVLSTSRQSSTVPSAGFSSMSFV